MRIRNRNPSLTLSRVTSKTTLSKISSIFVTRALTCWVSHRFVKAEHPPTNGCFEFAVKRRKSALSPVLATVILASTLLVLITTASFFANNAVSYQVDQAHFDQAKNILVSLAQVVDKITSISHSSGYVTASFQDTLPQFARNNQNLTLSIINGSQKWTYNIPVNSVKISGNSHVAVTNPEYLLGDGSILVTNVSAPLARVQVFQSNGAWVSLDYSRVRCIYVGVASYYNGTGYQDFNVVEVTLVNLIFGTFAPGEATQISVQSLGISPQPTIQTGSNFIIKASLTGNTSVNCTLRDLGGDPSRNLPVLINVVIIPVQISMLSAGG